jgi:hypothetical protein
LPSLSFYICGNSGEPSEDNPITVARKDETIKILLHFLEEPINRNSLSNNLSPLQVEMISNLIRLGLFKEKNRKISLNFPLLTLSDYEILDDTLTIIATELVDAFQHKWERISKLVSKMRNVSLISIEEALYNVVGCVIIDWLALQWLAKEGIIFLLKTNLMAQNIYFKDQQRKHLKEPTVGSVMVQRLAQRNGDTQYLDSHIRSDGHHQKQRCIFRQQ